MEALAEVRRGKLADRAFEHAAAPLADADRRLAQELVYGVLRLRGRLDYLIDRLVSGGLRRLEPDVLDILRLGAYQLTELDRVPAYAIVSEAVEAARESSNVGAARLTNAVLRRLSREGADAEAFPRGEVDPVGYLSSWGSHPAWLVERWLARWPFPQVEALVEYNNRRPAVYLTVLGARDGAVDTLRAHAIAAEPAPSSPASVRVESAHVARSLELVEAVVQDPGAAAVVDYAGLDPQIAVLDLCAAPGGKAAALAARGHTVWAFDRSRSRLERLLESKRRLGLGRLHVAVADSTRIPVSVAEAILLDAPCSGTGTLARHPDGRWRLRLADLERLVTLQSQLLDAGARALAPGGLMIYATCSLETEENEAQVEAFLRRHPDFQLDLPEPGGVSPELLGEQGELRVLPHSHGMDGAYGVRLRRSAA